jgi:succinoglycan biosynthesis protein ExoM
MEVDELDVASISAVTDRVPERELLGIPFAMLDLPTVVRMLGERAAGDPFVYVATPNAHHLVLLHRNTEGFAFGLSRAWFLTCDSRVLRRLGELLFARTLPVVTGSDLTLHLLRHVIDADDKLTIIGGNEQLRRDLADQFGFSRVALYSPPFGFGRDRTQLQCCIDFVRDHPARFVFLACGAPQSEVLAAHLDEAGDVTGIGLCIGASLLFATGQLKRAPRLWQALSLEWLHRLLQEPRLYSRLWRTQLPVLGIAVSAWLSRRGRDPHASRLQRPSAARSLALDGGTAVSIVVLCYDRMKLLERTLRACFMQRSPDGIGWEILVCDNHPDQLARPLIEALQGFSPAPLRYLPAPARNIARARNVGVAAAAGRYVAFVDDDEAPDADWLESYYACMERTGADAAFGPKIPVFATGAPPDWDRQARHYTTDFNVPADTRIGRVGRSGRVLGAGNSCMRVATCLDAPKPFNEQIGAADGEDTELYLRLLKAGRRFVWCPAAVVREVMSESRMTYAYMHARLTRGSRTSARCRISASEHRRATHAMLLAVGLAQLVGHGFLYGLTGEFFSRERANHRFGMARGFGKLTYRSGRVDFIPESSLPGSRPA